MQMKLKNTFILLIHINLLGLIISINILKICARELAPSISALLSKFTATGANLVKSADITPISQPRTHGILPQRKMAMAKGTQQNAVNIVPVDL